MILILDHIPAFANRSLIHYPGVSSDLFEEGFHSLDINGLTGTENLSGLKPVGAKGLEPLTFSV
jgi:hypothetical protein